MTTTAGEPFKPPFRVDFYDPLVVRDASEVWIAHCSSREMAALLRDRLNASPAPGGAMQDAAMRAAEKIAAQGRAAIINSAAGGGTGSNLLTEHATAVAFADCFSAWADEHLAALITAECSAAPAGVQDQDWEPVDEGDGFERRQFERLCQDRHWHPLFNVAQGLRMASMLGVKGASYTDMMAVYANECAKAATWAQRQTAPDVRCPICNGEGSSMANATCENCDGKGSISATPIPHVEKAGLTDATFTIAYCCICITDSGAETLHIFSSAERRNAFMASDQRAHVAYDYLVDEPQRYEGVTS